MQSESFLHDLPDFADLINVVSREKGIVPQLVEKDLPLSALPAQGMGLASRSLLC